MKAKDLVTIITTAVGTGTLTVFAFWSRPIEAGAGGDSPKAEIPQPVFSLQGVAMTMTPKGGKAFKAGEQPEFELTATNMTSLPISAAVRVAMTCSAPFSPLARTISVPTTLWQQEQLVTLGPNENRTITLSTRTNLPADKVISVTLRDSSAGKEPVMATPTAGGKVVQVLHAGMVALTFTTARPTPTIASLERPAGAPRVVSGRN